MAFSAFRKHANTQRTAEEEGVDSENATKGTYGLKTFTDPSDAVTDVVFVHGLTGNRENTWLHKSSGTLWPAKLLPHDLAEARILTFGYDADVVHFWSMTSQNHIRNHATNLVNALVQLRERTETEDRPILFVAHSLGGLVVEDALLSSRSSIENHLQSVYRSIRGICFMGTPHCGAELANWAAVLGNISGLVKTTNKNLLEILKPASEVLARIQSEFHQMLRTRASMGSATIDITCFFEELPVRGIGEIVPKHSAILPAFNSIGIHANHMEMTKFDGKDDPGYLSVSPELMRWHRGIRRLQKAQSGPSQTSSGVQSDLQTRSWSSNVPSSHEDQHRLPMLNASSGASSQGSHTLSGQFSNIRTQINGGSFQINGPARFG